MALQSQKPHPFYQGLHLSDAEHNSEHVALPGLG